MIYKICDSIRYIGFYYLRREYTPMSHLSYILIFNQSTIRDTLYTNVELVNLHPLSVKSVELQCIRRLFLGFSEIC